MKKAASFEEQAVQLDPDARARLAKRYQRQGRSADQQRAEAKVASLSTGAPRP